MSKPNTLNKYLTELIDEVDKEIEEATVSGDAAGYQTPGAFSDGGEKSKKKTKDVSTQAGYEIVNEAMDYSKLAKLLLTKNTRHPMYYNDAWGAVNIGGTGYKGGDLRTQFPGFGDSTDIKNLFYNAQQNPTKTKKEIEKITKGKIKVDLDGKGTVSYLKEDKIPGGLADNLSIEDIANKHKVDIDELLQEFRKGIKVEMEHTTDVKIAKEICLDHLFEDPKYYDKLATIENESINEVDKGKPGSVWKTWTGKYRAVAPNGWKASFESESDAKHFAKTGKDNESGAHATGEEDVRSDKSTNITWGESINEQFENIISENRWLKLKNDESMHTHKKLAVGLKELRNQLTEVEKFLGWYNKLKNINELDSDNYWKRTNRNIYKIKERIVNIAKKLQEIEK